MIKCLLTVMTHGHRCPLCVRHDLEPNIFLSDPLTQSTRTYYLPSNESLYVAYLVKVYLSNCWCIYCSGRCVYCCHSSRHAQV